MAYVKNNHSSESYYIYAICYLEERLPDLSKKILHIYEQVGMKMVDPFYYVLIGSRGIENSSQLIKRVYEVTQDKMQLLK